MTYPSLAGTNVARDYVEFPSQLLEHWLPTAEVLNRFALHYQTGQPIPRALVEKIERAATFNEGFDTVEYLASALVDLKLHMAGDKTIDPDAFERETLTALGMPSEIVMRHRTPQFGHIFAGDGYSAGYYSYLWSDTLTADAYEAFTEGKGPYDKEVAKRLRDNVFAIGNTIDPADAYRAFRGRDPASRPYAQARLRGARRCTVGPSQNAFVVGGKKSKLKGIRDVVLVAGALSPRPPLSMSNGAPAAGRVQSTPPMPEAAVRAAGPGREIPAGPENLELPEVWPWTRLSPWASTTSGVTPDPRTAERSNEGARAREKGARGRPPMIEASTTRA